VQGYLSGLWKTGAKTKRAVEGAAVFKNLSVLPGQAFFDTMKPKYKRTERLILA